jgi:uncharacterized protein (TIGR03435 family)
MKLLISAAFLVLRLAIPMWSQNPGPRLSFEVASIKPSMSGRPRIAQEPGGRFVATGVPLQVLMRSAYTGQGLQFSGMPAWTESDLWDIEAKAADGTVPPRRLIPDLTTPDTMALMLQSLLEDRFQLKMHHEMKEMPVYELTIAKGGLKIELSEDQTPPQFPDPGTVPPQASAAIPRGLMRMGRGEIEATSISFSNLLASLSALLGRRVIDKTGLQGLYDMKLQWTPDAFSAAGLGPFAPGMPRGPEPPPPFDPGGLSIVTAIQEQLGLKVDSTKAPVEVTVIDSVQKPAQN